MSGGRRYEAISRTRTPSASSIPEQTASSDLIVPIVFTGQGVCRVAVQEREQVYCFTADDPEQMIEAKDAQALLKTGLFQVGHLAGRR